MARATDTDLGNCRPYSIRDTYEEGDVVHHPVFDIGFVVEQLPDNKVEVIFRDGGARILVHNRGDLAARMPDIAEVPVPREAKKKKRAKKPDAPSDARPAAQQGRGRGCGRARPRRGAGAHGRVDQEPPRSATRSSRPRRVKTGAKAAKGRCAGRPRPRPSAGARPSGAKAPAKAAGRAPAKP